VILTEVDFEPLGERARNKLSVGMTRASIKLVMMLSRRAAGVPMARLDAAVTAGSSRRWRPHTLELARSSLKSLLQRSNRGRSMMNSSRPPGASP